MNTMEEMIKLSGFLRKSIMKRYIKTFKQNKLADGESLLDVAAPEKRPTKLLFATDRRVFYFKMDTTDTSVDKIFEYEDIIACEVDTNDTNTEIIIKSNYDTISIKQIPNKIADKIVDTIQGLIRAV